MLPLIEPVAPSGKPENVPTTGSAPSFLMIVKRSPVDVHAQLLGVSETRQLLEDQEFEIVGIEHFLFLPEFLFRNVGYLECWLRRVPLGGQYAVFARAR